MGQDSKIEWTHHTFNPWWGCTKVSAGCTHCYAESLDKRYGGDHWGPGKPRKPMSDKHWAEPLKWDRAAAKAGERHRVFCASMADVFEAEAPAGQLDRLWDLIRQTPTLDWLLLTKRPERITESLPADWGDGYPNVWLGTSVEDQAAADVRIPELLAVPAKVRFLSCEPLLGPVDVSRYLWPACAWWSAPHRSYDECKAAGAPCGHKPQALLLAGRSFIRWVIVGGESGPGSRPMHPDWARSLRDQCEGSGTAFLFKQWGEWAPRGPESMGYPIVDGVPQVRLTDAGQNGSDLAAQGGNQSWMNRSGKKAAGRLLDSRTWDGYPNPK